MFNIREMSSEEMMIYNVIKKGVERISYSINTLTGHQVEVSPLMFSKTSEAIAPSFKKTGDLTVLTSRLQGDIEGLIYWVINHAEKQIFLNEVLDLLEEIFLKEIKHDMVTKITDTLVAELRMNVNSKYPQIETTNQFGIQNVMHAPKNTNPLRIYYTSLSSEQDADFNPLVVVVLESVKNERFNIN